ncbi:competence protein ComER [Salsuginibacillus halophilus]|uniref:Competence protein ComER n=1 Tax=Salsuginibacillus halophilus TaxID=517424 RepID=A0A2P8HFS6_9BACI|nr:late competence protein ComER [Salsuginibacillus halophilus]PSL45051.1 competence protein ComER [Salsuginibacillus halophilus]
MKVGVIGTGTMGGMLAKTMVESGAVASENLMLFNRTKAKGEAVAAATGGSCVSTLQSLIQAADLIFIAVRPDQFSDVCENISGLLKQEQVVVSITSPVTASDLAMLLPCRTVQFIPSITNEAQAGGSLIDFGDGFNRAERAGLSAWFRQFSEPLPIIADTTRAASDLISCGPAFTSFILQEMMTAAEQTTSIRQQEAEQYIREMVIGMGELLKRGYSFAELQEKVCVPNGVTGVGLKVLEEQLRGVFSPLFTATHAKFAKDEEMVSANFSHARQKLNGNG